MSSASEGAAQRTVVCMKWGALYPADYVNRLYSMARRHTTGPLRFVCLTDDAAGVREEVETHPCPELPVDDRRRNLGWRKLHLWGPRLLDIEGDFLYLDLDVVIVADIDPLFEAEGEYVVMRNWTQPRSGIGNTSVFKLRAGSRPEVLQDFLADPQGVFREHNNSQTYVSRKIPTLRFFPDAWCALFKVHCVPPFPLNWVLPPRLPRGVRVVAFPGTPNPHQAVRGEWPAKPMKRLYKHIRPARWIDEHWR